MKNLVKALFVLAVSAFVLTSCNKEKAAVNKLEGAWQLASLVASETGEDCSGGTTVAEPVVTWNFTAYTVGDQESGSATLTVDTFPAVNYTYSVSEDGKELTLSTTGADDEVWTINTLSGSSLEMQRSDSITVITDCSTFAVETRFGTYTATLDKQ